MISHILNFLLVLLLIKILIMFMILVSVSSLFFLLLIDFDSFCVLLSEAFLCVFYNIYLRFLYIQKNFIKKNIFQFSSSKNSSSVFFSSEFSSSEVSSSKVLLSEFSWSEFSLSEPEEISILSIIYLEIFFFFNRIFTFFYKHVRIIIFTCLKTELIKITDRKINWESSLGILLLWKFVLIFSL